MAQRPDGPEYADPEVYRELAGFDREWRDTWWNTDFLRFMLARLEALEVQSILDVGCGAGHWGRALLRALPDTVKLSGVDKEESFARLATEQAETKDLADRTDYRAGTAEAIPFPDGSFDLVTCQTVLIHVADAEVAVAEMMRVAKPGGLVIAAEPDNLTSSSSLLNISPRPAREDVLAILELQMICEQGKIALGEGDSSIGGRLPGLFQQVGLEHVQVALNENCPLLLPPYESGAQPVQLEMDLELAGSDFAIFTGTKKDSLRLFVAGGGEESAFEGYWNRVTKFLRAFENAIRERRLSGARGQVFYLVTGRKP